MAFDLSSVTSGLRPAPLRIVLFGPHGTGKTTFAAGAPNPIFLPTEDGLGVLESPAFPLVSSTDEAIEALSSLHEGAHDFRTVALDSADWMDNIVQAEIAATHTEKERAYGKDSVLGAERWRVLLDWFNALRRDRGMHCILIAHCEIKQFDSPDGDSYGRYQPKIQARSSALLQEWADAVLFVNFKVSIKTEQTDPRKDARKRAVSTGERLMHTGEKPAYLAKNRYSLPETLPLSWQDLAANMPFEI